MSSHQVICGEENKPSGRIGVSDNMLQFASTMTPSGKFGPQLEAPREQF